MQTPRKQFGRRGLPVENAARGGQRQSSYSAGGGAAAYAAPGYGALPAGEEPEFSPGKAAGFALAMLFSFRGRIGRMEYWTIGIVRFILFMTLVFTYASGLSASYADIDAFTFFRGFVESGSGFFFLISFLVLTVCLYSLEVRRCHDRDVSGFWLLILLIPIIGGFYGLYIFVANGFFPGTPGTNRFDSAQTQARVFD